MATEFARKLRLFVDEAARDGRDQMRDALRDLADTIAEAFESDIEALEFDRKSASLVMEDARAGAVLIDAAYVLRTRVLAKGEAARFKEFKLPRARHFDALLNFVDGEVRPAIGDRPFVYVVWRRSPEAYLYVGQSENRDKRAERLKLDDRGKLMGAMEEGSLFTLMLPSPITATVAKDVEAAILSILDDRNQFPDYNNRAEKVPGALGSSHLEKVGRLLVDLGGRFKPRTDAMTQIVR